MCRMSVRVSRRPPPGGCTAIVGWRATRNQELVVCRHEIRSAFYNSFVIFFAHFSNLPFLPYPHLGMRHHTFFSSGRKVAFS